MGLFGSLIKTTIKVALTPVAVAGDLLTQGIFIVSDNGLLTERITKNLDKDINNISKELDRL